LAGGTTAFFLVLEPPASGRWNAPDALAYVLFAGVNVFMAVLTSSLREARVRADEGRLALAESEERLRLGADAAHMGAWTRDLKTGVVTWSPELARVFGIQPEEFGRTEQSFFEFVHSEDLPGVIDIVRTAVEHRGDYEVEFRFYRRDGQLRWMLARGKTYCDPNGEPARLAGIGIDVTDRKVAEEALRASEARYRSLIAATSSVVLTADATAAFAEPQPGWEEFTGQGWEAHRGWGWLDAIHPDDRDSVQQMWRRALDTKSLHESEGRLWHAPSQQYRYFVARAMPVLDADGSVREWVGTITDVDEKKRLDQKLLHADKLESLGVLAGGIAHDFNNLLVGIMGNASILEEMAESGSQTAEFATAIVQASERAADLTRQMLAYAGKGQFLIRKVDLSREVTELLPLLEPAMSRSMELRLDLAPALPLVEADPSQVQQIIMNLVMNAAEATPKGGVVTISTALSEEAPQDGFWAVDHAGQPEGYVVLRVRDTGHGMDDATRRKIFDPFFTTKFTGRGLGLAAVLGIVRAQRGGICVESEPGKGSTFTVYFPATAARGVSARAPAIRQPG
jgi:PAS domain S-box-containing protein